MDYLSYSAIIDYIGARPRCWQQGEQVFKAHHVFECGKRDYDEIAELYFVWALCLQSSALTSSPHELELEIMRNKVMKVACSCKAGKSGYCKHGCAVLLHLNRTSLSELKDISCTDRKQQWGKVTAKELYEPKPVNKFCCVMPSVVTTESTIFDEAFLDKAISQLCLSAPNSALALHTTRDRQPLSTLSAHARTSNRATVTSTQSALISSESNKGFKDLFSHLSNNSYLSEVERTTQMLIEELPASERAFYMDHVALLKNDCIELYFETLDQSTSNRWKSERRVRITGSICYSLYTYFVNHNPDWATKITSLLSNTFKGNCATQFGNVMESEAKKVYQNEECCEIIEFRLVVSPQIPWAGISPDGIIFRNGPEKLLEFKCPKNGENASFDTLFETRKLPFLEKIGETYQLKVRNKYYGQCQLCMALTNLTKCDFVVYTRFDNKIKIIKVGRDDVFINRLLSRLVIVYFKRLLPALSKESQNTKL